MDAQLSSLVDQVLAGEIRDTEQCRTILGTALTVIDGERTAARETFCRVRRAADAFLCGWPEPVPKPTDPVPTDPRSQ